MRVPFVLLGVAGVALYGSYSHFSTPSGRLAQLAQVSEIVTGGAAGATMTDATSSAPRIFSPQRPLLAPVAEPPPPAARRTAEPVPPVPVAVTRRSDPFGEAPAIRAVQPKAQPVANTAAPAPARRSAGSKPSTDEARSALVRDLQRELKRVGCFDGELSGWWNQGTRRAMGAFTERVNASLPVEEPDYILLALVQSHAGQACGTGCPGGQSLSNDGRCLPRAILAQSDKKGGRGDEAKAPESAETPSDADRRMQQSAAALAGQLAAAPAAPRSKTWETGVFPAAPRPVPAARPPAPVTTAAAPAPIADPLPGRMSIGAPVPSYPEARIAPPTTTASLPQGTEGGATRGSEPSSAGRASAPSRKREARNDYRPAPRVYYDAPPSRRRSGPSLRSAGNVKDFFFGAGRGSF